jgi:bacteriorhodopsin
MEGVLWNSKLASLLVQVITGVIGIYALTQNVPLEHIALKQSLGIEMFVQAIQISLYIWILFQFHIPSMALTRYIDWIITTPLMLISIMLYFEYERVRTTSTLRQFLQEHRASVSIVLVANLVMLIAGFLGEWGALDKTSATILGFFGLIIAFGTVYKEFIEKNQNKNSRNIFSIIFVIWSLYGVAYNLQDVHKNIFYNCLDIIAKNMFGLFLSVKVIRLANSA